MAITRSRLQQIIKEEINKAKHMLESPYDDDGDEEKFDYLDQDFDEDSDDEYDAIKDRAAETGMSVHDVLRGQEARQAARRSGPHSRRRW